jgi:hypothetical protein
MSFLVTFTVALVLIWSVLVILQPWRRRALAQARPQRRRAIAARIELTEGPRAQARLGFAFSWKLIAPGYVIHCRRHFATPAQALTSALEWIAKLGWEVEEVDAPLVHHEAVNACLRGAGATCHQRSWRLPPCVRPMNRKNR